MAQYAETIHGFPYFSQNDSRWSGVHYGGTINGNIGSSGCGPTSAAMILKSYGFDVTPEDMAILFKNAMNGYKTTEGKTCFPALSKSPYNLTVTQTTSINAVVNALKQGIPVVANPHGPCDFTAGGHYIVLCGINGSNQIMVNDPNGKNYEMCRTETWSADYINNCCVIHNPIDGFWIISKNGKGSIGTAAAAVKRYTNFPKCDLSENAIYRIAKGIMNENSSDVTSCRQEASQMCNQLEVVKGRKLSEENLLWLLYESGWYNTGNWKEEPAQRAIDAVRFVIVEGKRVLPRYVVEHDMFPLDAAISGHWYNGKSEDRSQYVRHKTIITQNPRRFPGGGGTYTFYCFMGDNGQNDVMGYFPQNYEKYKDDVPWTEGADEAIEGYMFSENSYAAENVEPTVIWKNRVHENICAKLQNTVPAAVSDTGFALYANGHEITKIAGNVSWTNSIYELATLLSFETGKSDAAYMKDLIYVPEVGDVVQMVTNEEVFRGIIKDVDDGGANVNKYTAADIGWYMNKTAQTYQFKNMRADDAIKELCVDLSIIVAMLPELPANINQIYFDKTISDILRDILDQCDGDYNFDFCPDGLRIYKIGELYAYPEFHIADNIPQVYSPKFRGTENHSISIEDMKTSVKVTSEKDNVYSELAVLQNRDLINKYGFLQKIVKIDPEKENAETAAGRELKENSKPKESYSFEIIEKFDSYTRAGEIMGIDGTNYVIESTNHRIKGGRHYNAMELRRLT